MLVRPPRPARSRGRLASALLLVLLALVVPSTAAASINYTLDVKAHPSVFQANTEVDVPLYLVENRAPDVDRSSFDRYRVGLRETWFDLGSEQSRFLGFTPAAAFDGRGTNVDSSVIPNYEVFEAKVRDTGARSRIYVRLYSLKGAPVTVDGSGITGRTELFLGTLRVAVGDHGPEVGGQRIVFDYTVGHDPSAPDPGFAWWNPAPTTPTSRDWGVVGGTGITWPRQTRVFWDGKAENEGNAPGDGSGAGGPKGPGVPAGVPGGGNGPGALPGGPVGPGGPTAPGAPAGAGSQAPGVSALGYSGRLKRSGRPSRQPFSVLARKPKKGTPAVRVRVTGRTKLTATLARAGKGRKRFSTLKGQRVFTVTSLETYLKLTGSWNAKTLPKGIYRLTLRSPSGTAQTVEFRVS